MSMTAAPIHNVFTPRLLSIHPPFYPNPPLIARRRFRARRDRREDVPGAASEHAKESAHALADSDNRSER
jgi:hypothetical protein